MKQYLQLLQTILETGVKRPDRTGTGTIGVFGYQMRFDLANGFPLLTTKKVHLKAIIHELLWFLTGDTNIRYLVQNGVKIWNEWPYEKFKRSTGSQITIDEYADKIRDDEEFSRMHGNLGPVYGAQWRNFGHVVEDCGINADNSGTWYNDAIQGVDQITQIIEGLRKDPYSRRHIVSAWNPRDISSMALPPCHCLFQFFVAENRLSCQLYQRSCDVFLGVPFNIASYSLLTMMIAQVTGLQLGEFVHTLGDAHLYINHLDQARLQLTREPKVLPKMIINSKVKDIFGFKYDDFRLEGYMSDPAIAAPISI